jgi:hypothetical protein
MTLCSPFARRGFHATLSLIFVVVACVFAGLVTPQAASAAPVTGVSFAVSATTVEYNSNVRMSGTMAPATLDVPVEIEIKSGTTWKKLGETTTGAHGNFIFDINLKQSGAVRARINWEGAERVSASKRVEVIPIVTITRNEPSLPFVGAQVRATVFPTTYSAQVLIKVSQAGRGLDTALGSVGNGAMSINVPTPGVGQFRAEIIMPKRYAIAASRVVVPVVARSSNLSPGSSGPEVRALNMRLRELGFLTTNVSTTYSFATGEAVLAFRKWFGLQRTRNVNDAVWRRMGQVVKPNPRYAKPATHIEVSKSKQTLAVVKNGKIAGIIHVSTGATGNTPVGTFEIYQRGGSYLYKFMAFKANFGIHGYDPVPEYPASHGCVREPMWAALWVWNQSFLGETVYVSR